MEHLEDFLSVFNDRYPFERYIFNTPCSLGNLFDDVLVTEVFVPSTEIKPYFSDDGQYIDSTEVPVDEIYLKLKGPGGEFRMGLIDFDKPIYENVIFKLYEDTELYDRHVKLYRCPYELYDVVSKEFVNPPRVFFMRGVTEWKENTDYSFRYEKNSRNFIDTKNDIYIKLTNGKV